MTIDYTSIIDGGSSIEHTYLKAKPVAKAKRVWFEGLRLPMGNFEYKTAYRTIFDKKNQTIIMIVDPEGDREVSGRKKKGKICPIIELFNSTVSSVLGDANQVRVDVYLNVIVVKVHHHEAKRIEREKRLIEHLSRGYIDKGSLCTGIGMAALAMDQGTQEAGIKSNLKWIVDRDSKYLRVACDNNDAVTCDTKVFTGALEEIEPHLLGAVDHLQVSLSCNGQSKSGKSKNQIKIAEEHGKDASGVVGLTKIIEATNPIVLTSENVIDARISASYLILKAFLNILGYNIYEKTLDEVQSGSMEKRKRYWLVAVSKGLPEFTFDYVPNYPRVYETMADVKEVGEFEWSDNQYLKDKAIRDKKDGKGFHVRNLITDESTSVNVSGKWYQKRRSTEPMWVSEDGQERLMTTKECARVKNCPEKLIENVSASTAYEGLGQGIDFNQGRGLAAGITTFLLESLPKAM